MANDEYLFDIVKWMFDTAREHVEWQLDPYQLSTIKSIVRELSRRADYCKFLVEEVQKKQVSQKALDDTHGEVLAFMLMLEPFVLKDDEKELECLLHSHYQDITILYENVKEAYGIIVEAKDKNSFEEDIDARTPATRWGRPKST